MTFAALEVSRQKGMPSNILLFRYGTQDNAYFAYTTADRIVTHATIPYNPLALELPAVSASGTLDKAVVEISIPMSSELAQLLAAQSQSSVVSLTIRQGHIGDPDTEWPVTWVGRVLGGSIEVPMMKLFCEPVSTSLKRTMLRRHYTRQCPFVLYGDDCKASLAAASAAYIPETVQDFGVTMAIGWVLPAIAQKYLGGFARWSGVGGDQVRTIVRVTSDRILLFSGPTTDLAGAEQITLVFGCSHTLTISAGAIVGDCKDLHNNLANYGGQLWIPLKNPVGVANNIFY